MRLELGNIPVTGLAFGDRTSWRDGVVTIDRKTACDTLRSIPGIVAADVALVSPGESARIVHALDAVEPRFRPAGTAYPGADGPVAMAGDGTTLRLAGSAVIVSCEVPWRSRGGLLMAREGIIDMSGPGAIYSPLAATHNIVGVTTLEPELSDEGCEQATRSAALRLAAHVGACAKDVKPADTEVFELARVGDQVPRVVYIYQIQSQALWARTFLYGFPLDNQLPVLLHPNELLDGALVSGNQVYQNHKIPTWLHANNPVVRDLYARHGRDVDFRGVILSKGYFYTDEAKHRSALMAARLAGQVGATGAVITWEGGGNSIVEAMLTVQACERQGIRTVLIAYEMGSGDREPLIFSVPEADAIVSSANTEAPVRLPPVARVVGGDTIRLRPEVGGVRMDAAGALGLDATYEMYCGANRVGAGRFGVRTF